MKKIFIGLSVVFILLFSGCGTPEMADKRYVGDGESLRQLKKSCHLKDGFICSRLGFLYMNGEGVRKNYTKAKRYYSKACELNDKSGCYMLGFFYEYGSGGVEQDYSKAKSYYSRACDLSVIKGCVSYKELKEKGY